MLSDTNHIDPKQNVHRNNEEDVHQVLDLLTLGNINRDDIGSPPWTNIFKLDLYGAALSSLPHSLPNVLPNLSIFFCMKNKFTIMPAVIGQCRQLQMVSFKSNRITYIEPEALAPQMRWLILTDNQIESIPSTIGNCCNLQKFMLSGNRLRHIPVEIASCHALELIRLSSNLLEEPPMTLLQLSNLSWIALSDNPFLSKCASNFDLELELYLQESLDDPSIGEELGRGASGVTRKYSLATGGEASGRQVAVKEYYATITSDGNPKEERKVSLVASSLGSDAFVKVLGTTMKGNLVMELLSDYMVFAGPPSMESCSRDVYDESMCVSLKRAVAIVDHMLFALMNLHNKGICHGDFYGHNILISTTDEDKAWLTDFGAAFFYHKDSEYGELIERIERRAFKHLVEEVFSVLKDDVTVQSKELFSTFIKCIDEQSFVKLYQTWSNGIKASILK